MIEKVTIPFNGPARQARAFVGIPWKTRLGVGRVQEVEYRSLDRVLVLHVYVKPKPKKTVDELAGERRRDDKACE
jgi:hypothetical protein